MSLPKTCGLRQIWVVCNNFWKRGNEIIISEVCIEFIANFLSYDSLELCEVFWSIIFLEQYIQVSWSEMVEGLELYHIETRRSNQQRLEPSSYFLATTTKPNNLHQSPKAQQQGRGQGYSKFSWCYNCAYYSWLGFLMMLFDLFKYTQNEIHFLLADNAVLQAHFELKEYPCIYKIIPSLLELFCATSDFVMSFAEPK